jgi:signal peptidase II
LKKGYQVALLVLVVLLIDQATKFYIKTTFEYNGEVLIFGQEWARLHFVENEGMAFGMTLDWEYGKLTLKSVPHSHGRRTHFLDQNTD